MKLIHTADWHLGQSFHGQDRHYEHRCFLDWLLDELETRRPDALLIAGDVFDVVNPSMKAQELLYDFIVQVHERLPRLTVAMIAGNHDSGARIELPGPLMKRLRAHALGRVLWLDDGTLDAERLLVPLENERGEIKAWCLALPFLRPAEVTGSRAGGEIGDDYIKGITRVHEALISAAEAKRQPGQALVAMSHAHLRGAAVSEHSERPIVIGGEESLSAALFPPSIGYVALGHLHRPQQVGEPRIRYSGSPLPMDFSERDYPHQVVELEFIDETLERIRAIPIPRAVDMLRVGPAPLENVLEELKGLEVPKDNGISREAWPWLDVRVRLDAPRVDLRAQIEAALHGKAVRLICISTEYRRGNAKDEAAVTLDDLGPQALFERAWQREYGAAPDEDVVDDFNALLQSVLDAEHREGETP
ncbi:exonuclease SbcCD subunit D C-terminal domain-containing protein [Phytohalomonas tamaricis]|uniref:exonuclease SbcCD subunit D C-terminal domain-containing protein n=1 Tax=Phytohalomonas tamaricis TaxID=2081032 RepID=UPI000D0ABCCB|nr:exonuclease SbcCD subunit D C-terminal domain-containing protein [Phytohalomonas tamaricis]